MSEEKSVLTVMECSSCKQRSCVCEKKDKAREGDQPMPTPNEHPAIADLVMADFAARKQLGIKRYGVALQGFNGRNGLRDLYEELQDAVVYTRQVLYEQEFGKPQPKYPVLNRCAFEKLVAKLDYYAEEVRSSVDMYYDTKNEEDRCGYLGNAQDYLEMTIEACKTLLANTDTPEAVELPEAECGSCDVCRPVPVPEKEKVYAWTCAAVCDQCSSIERVRVHGKTTPSRWAFACPFCKEGIRRQGTDWEQDGVVSHPGMKVTKFRPMWAPPPLPTVVVLCGSTRFYKEFQKANFEETAAGKIVLSIGFYPTDDPSNHGGDKHITPEEKIKADELHKRKIDLASEVYILNVGGYIGESTQSELEYAKKLGKTIRFLEPIK